MIFDYALRGLNLTPRESIARVPTLSDGDPIDEYGLLALQCALGEGTLTWECVIRVTAEDGIAHNIRLDSDGEFMDPWPLPNYRLYLLMGNYDD